MIDMGPFPRFRIETNNRIKVVLVQAIYALTEGLVGRGFRFAIKPFRRFLGDERAMLVFEDGSRFAFPIADPYWNRLVAVGYQYEPEIAHVLRCFKELDYTFIDAGANYGFWSVLVSSPSFGAKRAIAVEAAMETLKHLEFNRQLNHRRFEIVHGAVFDVDDKLIGLSPGDHSSRHLTTGTASERVTSLRLDTLAHRAGIAPHGAVVIKLDIEGAESAALSGAECLLEGETLVIYEDHGSDPSHAITRHVREVLGLQISHVDGRGSLVPIDRIQRLTSIKRNPYAGYNFIASRPGTSFQRQLSTLP